MPEHDLQQTVSLLSRTPGALNALLRDLPDTWTSRNEGESNLERLRCHRPPDSRRTHRLDTAGQDHTAIRRVIGCLYLVSPERISGSFGLKPPASDGDTRAWLRPKGIRDIVAGLVVLTMMLAADGRLVGIALLVEAIIPLGDMLIILGSGGSKSRAFSIHGVTCAAMLVVGLSLIHAIGSVASCGCVFDTVSRCVFARHLYSASVSSLPTLS
jgi:Domain of unknown function (DUF4267)